jgi:hypothetical protein
MVKHTFQDGIIAICVAIILLVISGCACKPKIEYRVADIPEPPVITRPALDVLEINNIMDPGTIIQLHRSTILKLKSWGLELETALDAYRKPKDTK